MRDDRLTPADFSALAAFVLDPGTGSDRDGIDFLDSIERLVFLDGERTLFDRGGPVIDQGGGDTPGDDDDGPGDDDDGPGGDGDRSGGDGSGGDGAGGDGAGGDGSGGERGGNGHGGQDAAPTTLTADTGTASVDLSGTADNDRVTIGTTLGDGVSVGSLVLTGAEAVTLTSTGSGTNTIGSLAGSDTERLTILGATDLSLTTGAAALEVIDASGFTGDLSVDASANTRGLRLTGGSGDDTLFGSAFADAIDGRGGDNLLAGRGGQDELTLSGGDNDTVDLTGITQTADRDLVIGFRPGDAGRLGLDVIRIDADDTSADTPASQTPELLVFTPSGGGGLLGLIGGLLGGVVGGLFGLLTGPGGAASATDGPDIVELHVDLSAARAANQDLDGATDGSALLAALGSPIDSTGTGTGTGTGQQGYLIAYQDDTAYLYHIDDDSAANTLQAGDVSLVATLSDITVGALTADNFDLV